MNTSRDQTSEQASPSLNSATENNYFFLSKVVNTSVSEWRQIGLKMSSWKSGNERHLRSRSSQTTDNTLVKNTPSDNPAFNNVIFHTQRCQCFIGCHVTHRNVHFVNDQTNDSALVMKKNRMLLIFSQRWRFVQSYSYTQNVIKINERRKRVWTWRACLIVCDCTQLWKKMMSLVNPSDEPKGIVELGHH